MKSLHKQVGVFLLVVALLLSTATPLVTLAGDEAPVYGKEAFGAMAVLDPFDDTSKLLSVADPDNLVCVDSLIALKSWEEGNSNELVWQIKSQTDRIAMQALYYKNQVDMTGDWLPTAANRPVFQVSADNVSWTDLTIAKTELIEDANAYQIRYIHWIDTVPESAQYLKMIIPDTCANQSCYEELRTEGGVDTPVDPPADTPAYGKEGFDALEVFDPFDDTSKLLSIANKDNLVCADSVIHLQVWENQGNELVWRLPNGATRIAMQALYYKSQVDTSDWMPTAANLPVFRVSADNETWTDLTIAKTEIIVPDPNIYQIRYIHWIDTVPENAKYLKMTIPDTCTGESDYEELRTEGGVDTPVDPPADTPAYGKEGFDALEVFDPFDDTSKLLSIANKDNLVCADSVIHLQVWENQGNELVWRLPNGATRIAMQALYYKSQVDTSDWMPTAANLPVFRVSADNETWTDLTIAKTEIIVPDPNIYQIRYIHWIDTVPENAKYLKMTIPDTCTGESDYEELRIKQKAAEPEEIYENADNLARFDALTVVDSFADVSRFASVLYKNGYAVRKGLAEDTRFRKNDDTLSFAASTYTLQNELTWEFAGDLQPVLAVYYPKTLLDEQGNVPAELAPAFYVSSDRFNWTELDTVETAELGSYAGQKLISFWGADTPVGTTYLKVAYKTGEAVAFSELRSKGTADHTATYAEVFYDPMDTSIRPAAKCDVIFFNDVWGLLSAGQGEMKDFRRDDTNMGVLRTYWPEDDKKELWVDYKVPLNSRVTIETYLQNIVWKRNANGVIMAGTLADEIADYGTFKVYTSADGKTWTPAGATMAVYPGFSCVEGTWINRDFDKVVYGIDKMPEGHTMVRICLPNYLSAETINGTRIKKDPENPDTTYDWIWIPSIKSIKAELPVSGLDAASAVDEGALEDIPVLDDCGDLSLVEPTSYENIRVQLPNGVSVGQTDPGDAAFVRLHGDLQTALSWTIGSRSKVAVIAYQHSSTLSDGKVKEDSMLSLLTGQNRFELEKTNAEVKVLGRVGSSEYYKVAYVLEETRAYDTLLRVIFPKTANGTDIAITTVRATAGVKEDNPDWKVTFHDTCFDDTYVESFEGGVQFVYDEVVRDGVYGNDGAVLPDGDLERVFPTAARIDNAIVWKVKPGSRVIFKAGYMTYMWGRDQYGNPDYTALAADRAAAGDEFMPKLYTSIDNIVWDEITDYSFEFVPAYYIDDVSGLSEHRFDFGYFYIDSVPADAEYVIFEFPGQYRNNWEIKLHDVLAEEPTVLPEKPDDNGPVNGSGNGPDNGPETGLVFPWLPLAAAAASAPVLPLLRRRKRK